MTAGVFLTAQWRDLAILNFVVDPQILLPRVPGGTVLDLWKGDALVSVLGFRFLDTRVFGLPIPLHRDFEEVNLRFYVRRDHPGGARRGVVFVKELVPRRAIAAVARRLYNENYVALPMSHEILEAGDDSCRATYRWWNEGDPEELSIDAVGPPTTPENGSEEEFITEHYWGYARQRSGSTLEYQVEHPRWRVRRARQARLTCDAGRLYGAQLAPALAAPPRSAFLAEGSPVRVRRGEPLAPIFPGTAPNRRART